MVPQQSCRVLAAAITLIACSSIMLSTTAKAEDVTNDNLPSTLSCSASEDRAACSCCPSELRTSYADGQLTLVGVIGSSGVDPCPGLENVYTKFQCDVDGDADRRCSGTHNGFEFGVSRSAGGDVELRAPCGSYTAVSTFPYVDCPTCSKASWNTNTFYQSNSLKLWTPFKEGDITNFYMVVNKKVTYQDASEVCEANGASLAAIQTPAENSFLGDWLERIGIELPVWIGAKRANKKVGFKWNDLQMMDESGTTFEKALTGTEARWGLNKEPLPACSHDAECAPDCCLMSNRKGTGKENCLMMGAPLSYLARDEVQRPFWYTAGCSKTKRYVCKKVRGKPPPTCGLPRGMAHAINAASSNDPGRARRQVAMSSSPAQKCSEGMWCAGLIELNPAACFGDLQKAGQCRCSCSDESESEDSDATSNVTTTATTTTIRKCNPRPEPEIEFNKTVCNRSVLNMTEDEFMDLCSEEYFSDECPIACAEDGYYCNYDPKSTTTTTTLATTSTETTTVSKEEVQNSGDSGIADESSGLSGSSDNGIGSGSIEEPPTTTTSTMSTTTTTTVTTVTRDPNCKVHPMIDGVNGTQETDFLTCSECIGRYSFSKDDSKPAVCTLTHCKHGNANSVEPYNNISDHEDCGVMPLEQKYCTLIPQLVKLCPFMCDDCPVTTTTTTATSTKSTTTTTITATTTTTLSTTTTTYVDQTCYLERDFNQTTNKLNDLAMPPREDDAVCGEQITKHDCDENELVKSNICPCMCTANDPNTTLVDVADVCNGGRDTDICKKDGSFYEYDCNGPLDDPTANAKRALCPVTCSSCTTTPSTSTATSTTTSTSTSTSTATSTTGMSTSTGPYCGPDQSVCDRLSATLCGVEQVFTWCPNMCNSTKCDTTTVTTSQTTTMCSTGPDNLFCPELPEGACELAKKGIELDPTEGVSRLILNECGAMCDSCVTSTSTVTRTSSSTSTTTSTASSTSTSTSSSTVTTTSASTCNGSKDIEVCRGLTKPLCTVDGLMEILQSMCPVLCNTCTTTEAPPTTTSSSSTSTSTSTATATLTPTTTSTSTSTSTSSTTSTSTTPFVNGQKVPVGCADGYMQESGSIDATSVYVCGNQGELEPAVGQRALSCVLRPTTPPAATASPTAAPTPQPATAATTVTMTTSAAPTSAPTNNQDNVFAVFDAVATNFQFNFDDAGAPLLSEIFKSNDREKYEGVLSEVLERCLDACFEADTCGAVVLSVAKVFADSHVYATENFELSVRLDVPHSFESPANYTCTNLGLGYARGGAKAQDGSENGGESQVYWGFSKQNFMQEWEPY